MIPSHHWAHRFEVTDDDLEYLSGLLLERETPLSSADLARAFARWMGYDPNAILTSTIAESATARPARVVLDSSLAATMGFRARPIAQALAD